MSLHDSGTILYPSITFCKKYTWDSTWPGLLELIQKNNSITEEEARQFAINNVWSRDKAFSFFSHQNVKKESFPCNTVSV